MHLNRSGLVALLLLLISNVSVAETNSCLFAISSGTSKLGLSVQEKKKTKNNLRSLLRNALLDTSNGSVGIGSVLQSLISDLEISGLAVSDDQNSLGEPLTITHNISAFNDSEGGGHNASLQFRFFRNPILDADLATAVGEEKAEELRSQIGEADDVEVGFSYSWMNSSAGRSVDQYINDFDELVIKNLETDSVKKLVDERNRARAYYISALDDEGIENCSNALGLDDHVSDKVKVAYFEALNSQNKLSEVYSSFNSAYDSKKFAALVSNQPQILLSGFYRSRNNLLGASELGIQLSYEMGFRNINGLRKFKKNNPNLNALKAYKTYVGASNPILNDDRVAFSIAYSDIEDFAFNNGDEAFIRRGGARITLNASYGRALLVRNETPILRFDAGAELIEFMGNSEGVDRIVGSATLTYRVDEKLSIPFTIEYANRSEFLSDDTNTISANLGFKYDFDFAK